MNDTLKAIYPAVLKHTQQNPNLTIWPLPDAFDELARNPLLEHYYDHIVIYYVADRLNPKAFLRPTQRAFDDSRHSTPVLTITERGAYISEANRPFGAADEVGTRSTQTVKQHIQLEDPELLDKIEDYFNSQISS